MKWYICRTIASYLSPLQTVYPTIKHHHQHHPNQQKVTLHRFLPQATAPPEANNPSPAPQPTTVTRKNHPNPSQNPKVSKSPPFSRNPPFVHDVPKKNKNNNRRLLQRNPHRSSSFRVVANRKLRRGDSRFPIICHRVANEHRTVRRVAGSRKVPVHQDLRQVKAISVLTNACAVWRAIFGTNRECEMCAVFQRVLSLLAFTYKTLVNIIILYLSRRKITEKGLRFGSQNVIR